MALLHQLQNECNDFNANNNGEDATKCFVLQHPHCPALRSIKYAREDQVHQNDGGRSGGSVVFQMTENTKDKGTEQTDRSCSKRDAVGWSKASTPQNQKRELRRDKDAVHGLIKC